MSSTEEARMSSANDTPILLMRLSDPEAMEKFFAYTGIQRDLVRVQRAFKTAWNIVHNDNENAVVVDLVHYLSSKENLETISQGYSHVAENIEYHLQNLQSNSNDNTNNTVAFLNHYSRSLIEQGKRQLLFGESKNKIGDFPTVLTDCTATVCDENNFITAVDLPSLIQKLDSTNTVKLIREVAQYLLPHLRSGRPFNNGIVLVADEHTETYAVTIGIGLMKQYRKKLSEYCTSLRMIIPCSEEKWEIRVFDNTLSNPNIYFMNPDLVSDPREAYERAVSFLNGNTELAKACFPAFYQLSRIDETRALDMGFTPERVLSRLARDYIMFGEDRFYLQVSAFSNTIIQMSIFAWKHEKEEYRALIQSWLNDSKYDDPRTLELEIEQVQQKRQLSDNIIEQKLSHLIRIKGELRRSSADIQSMQYLMLDDLQAAGVNDHKLDVIEKQCALMVENIAEIQSAVEEIRRKISRR